MGNVESAPQSRWVPTESKYENARRLVKWPALLGRRFNI